MWTDGRFRPAGRPWWVQTLAIGVAARAATAAIFLLAAAGQPASYWDEARPDYFTFTGVFWDAEWYREIAEDGYPATLPRDPEGNVVQNAWAFFPLFPFLVRALMAVTGLPWHILAPTTALLTGLAALLVIDRVVTAGAERIAAVEARLGDRRDGRPPPNPRRLALGTVTLVATFPSAPVLQVAYTESLALLLIALAILGLVRRSYATTAIAVVALGFTRAVALPMAAVVAWHLVQRLRAHRAGRDPVGPRAAAGLGGLALLTLAAGVAWPLLVGFLTGVPDAYVRTQAAWRGGFSSAPFVPWLEMSDYLFGGAGPVVLVAVVGATFALALSRAARAAGPEVQAWGVAYPAYLLAAAFPQSSTFRFLVLAFPLGLATAGLLRGAWSWAKAVALGLAGQAVWIFWLWQLTTPTAWPP